MIVFVRIFAIAIAAMAWLSLPPAVAPSAQPVQARPDPPQKPKPTREEDDRQRKKVLSAMLDRLATAEDVQTAQTLEQAIWRLWLQSGSPTIDILTARAIILMNKGAFDKALKLLDTVIRLAPDYAEGWNKRATVLFFMGQYERSRYDISRTLALEPRHFGALSGLGLVMREINDKKAALEAFRRALKVHPFLPGALEAVKILGPEVEGREL